MSGVLPVPNIQTSSSVNFKGKVEKTARGNDYYATDMGGKILGGLAAVNGLVNTTVSPNKGAALLGTAVSTGINYAIGHYVDNKRNEHAAEAADYIQTFGVQKAQQANDRIRIADNGKAYYNSNDGRKYLTRIFAAIGGVAGLISAGFFGAIAKHIKNMPKMSFLTALVALPAIGAAGGAIGGWINGAIVDWLNNRSAKKHA